MQKKQGLARFIRTGIAFVSILSVVGLYWLSAPLPIPKFRVVIISLDGMADWLLDDLLAAGEMPNIQRVLDHGFAANHAVTTFPAKTAVAHAAIWTGTDPSRTGVHANSVVPAPYRRHTILETMRGFSAEALQAEPIWSAAARQGKRAVVVQATQNYPFTCFLGPHARFPAPAQNLLMYNGYDPKPMGAALLKPEGPLLSAQSWPRLPAHAGVAKYFAARVGDTPLDFLFYDDPRDAIVGLDTLWICSGADGETRLAELKPLPPTDGSTIDYRVVPVVYEGQESRAWFRLFSLSPDGSAFRLFHAQIHHFNSSDPADIGPVLESGGFVGNAGWGGEFTDGSFGPILAEGGDGSAERAFIETVRLSTDRFANTMQTALRKPGWDLLIGYIPYPDDANHPWLGFAAPPCGGRDTPMGRLYWPYLLDVYHIVDSYVGAVYDAMPDDALLVIVSDHGYTSFDRLFLPNVLLRDAGLLALDAAGKPDLSRTRAMYYPGSGDFVFVNSTRFKEGIVPMDQVARVKEEVAKVLTSARDERGQAIVQRIVDPRTEPGLNMTGPYAGDLYLSLAPGYYSVDDWDGDQPYRIRKYPAGNHFGDPRRRQMNSIFLMGGKNARFVAKIGEMRAIDVAPTLSALLGIQPPRQATGVASTEIVAAVQRAREQ